MHYHPGNHLRRSGSVDVPEKILFAAERLREGRRINRITVRDFLRHCGAERRGAAKIQKIRGILDSLNLDTEPDFETAWIDGPIKLRLKDGVSATEPAPAATSNNQPAVDLEEMVLEGTPSAVKQAEEQSEAAPTSVEPDAAKSAEATEVSSVDDPTFRIGSLP